MAAVSRKRRLTQECIETATRVMRIYDTMPYLQKPRIGSGGENNFKTISSKQPSRALLCLQRHNNRLYCDRPIRSSSLLANMKSTNKQSSINSVVEASKTTYRLAKHSETFSNIRSDIEEVKSMLGRGVFCFLKMLSPSTSLLFWRNNIPELGYNRATTARSLICLNHRIR